MKNTDLLALAIKAKDGATAHPEITLMENMASKIQLVLSAVQSAEADYQGAVTAIVPLQSAYEAVIADACTFAQRAKDVLKAHCGNQSCDLWNVTGFVGLLKVPSILR